MPVVVVGAIVGGVVLAVASGIHTASGQLSACGAVCYVAVIAIGVPTCVRINKQVAGWSIENPPGDWTAVRARWIRFHVIRTLFSVPAFALYAAAMILPTEVVQSATVSPQNMAGSSNFIGRLTE